MGLYHPWEGFFWGWEMWLCIFLSETVEQFRGPKYQ